jgi:hypothetical protein
MSRLKSLFPLACALAGLWSAGMGPAHALASGDLMFAGFNADADRFAMIAMTDIGPYSSLYFTDNEWNGQAIGAGGAFNSGESYQRWETGAAVLSAGTVITFKVGTPGTLSASVGSFGDVGVPGNTGYGLSQTAETIYAYVGNAALNPTGFIGALSSGGFSDRDGTIKGTGLVLGESAIELAFGSDFAEYNGPRGDVASVASYRQRIGNRANWVDGGDGSYGSQAIDTRYFPLLLTPTPEPAGLVLALAGGALLSWRRRASRG